MNLRFSSCIRSARCGPKTRAAIAVNAMHEDLRDLRRGQKLVATEMRGLRGRIERLEDRQLPIDA